MTVLVNVVLCAVVYALVWAFGDREARETTFIAAIPSWLMAFGLAVLIAGSVFVVPTFAQVQGPPIWCCDNWWLEWGICWYVWLGC